MPIRVVIADDHEIFRDGFKAMLNRQSDVKVVGEASNGEELIQVVSKTKPDVIITDIKMPKMNGIEATRILKSKHSAIPVIALTMIDEETIVIDMMESGASGYLLKNANKSEILEAIKAVNEGHIYYCNDTTARLTRMIAHSRFNEFHKKPKPVFTEREIEIIRLICEELTNKEIAEKLGVTTRTVENHRDRIQEKIGARNSAGIVVYAIRNNIFNNDIPLK